MAPRKNIDWTALLIEYLSGDNSLESLRRKHKIKGIGWFAGKTKGWVQRRERIRAEAVAVAEGEIRNRRAKKWLEYTDSFGKIRTQVQTLLEDIAKDRAKKLKAKKSKDATAHSTGLANELKALAHTLELGIRSESLIEGGPTARIAATIDIPGFKNFVTEVARLLRERIDRLCPNCRTELKTRSVIAEVLEEAAKKLESAEAVKS